MILNVKDLNKSFSDKTLFNNLSLVVNENERVALIGENGVGKTTLFRILEGLETYESGSVFWKSNTKIGFLEQLHDFDEEDTVERYFFELYAAIQEMEKRLNRLEEEMKSDHSEKIMSQYAALQEDFLRKNGYNLKNEILAMLTRFGFGESDLKRPMNTFSGGQITRLSFIKLLLSNPDVLFLDEPTNHLDMETIVWLEGYLKNYQGTLILISHDRLFLDRICNVVIEIEHCVATRYVGNYTAYKKLKEVAIERHNIQYKNQQREIERLEKLIEKFRYNKNKAAFAQSKIKYLDRMDKLEKIEDKTNTFKASFETNVRGGKDVLILNDFTIGYTKPLLSVTLTLNRGRRYALVGENGSGKSTLLKTIMERIPALSGEMLLGHQIEIGYFDQELLEFSKGNTVIEEVWDEYPQLTNTEIRTILARFLFKGDDVFKSVNVLSGGERVRLSLVKLMLSQRNFLILDEPTNHLDIAGKEALEDALQNFPGTILFVSHDRYFVERLASDLLVIENGVLIHTEKNIHEAINESNANQTQVKKERSESYKDLKKLQRTQKRLEEQLETLHDDLEALRSLRFEPEYYHDYKAMDALNEDIDKLHNEIKAKEEEWTEISLQLEN